MKRTAQELAEFLDGELEGPGSVSIEGIADLETAGTGDLSYAEPDRVDKVSTSRAACVLVSGGRYPARTTIRVANPKAAFARAAVWLNPPAHPAPGVHPTAIVSGDAEVGRGVSVGAHSVIEAGAVLGASSVISAGCHIGSMCRIGVECMIHSNVVLYSGVELGDRVVLHAGVVIGSDGFGFVQDGDTYVKFPQVGSVRIGDDVEIGANSTVDRGSLGQTVIGRGTKLDNLCHVAHNVRIGENTVIAAQTGVSGSVIIGDNAVIAGQVGIADHVRIDSGAVVGAQCGIPSGKRIRAGEVFWGTPARPLKNIKVQQAYISRLPRFADELSELRRQVAELTKTG